MSTGFFFLVNHFAIKCFLKPYTPEKTVTVVFISLTVITYNGMTAIDVKHLSLKHNFQTFTPIVCMNLEYAMSNGSF